VAETILNTHLTWFEGLGLVAVGEGSHGTMVLDTTAEAGGNGTGITPMEALLGALGGCMSMDVISILRKKRQRVTGFRVNLQGQRAEEHPRRYTHIAMEFVVRGFSVAPEAVARSIELSHAKYCSVAASLNAEIETSYRVVEEGAEE